MFNAKPCIEIPLLILTPIAAIFFSILSDLTQTPVFPFMI